MSTSGVGRPGLAVRGERAVLIAFWCAAVLACALGALDRSSEGAQTALGAQAVDLVRVITTSGLMITLLIGPGILLRHLTGRAWGLGFIWLPGFALLAGTGLLAWILAPGIHPRDICFVVAAVVLAAMAIAWRRLPEGDLLAPDERLALCWIGCGLGLAIARSLWSIGPVGELYDGTVSRTLNVEPRPDSAISYLVAEMVAHGSTPYGKAAFGLFLPYNFSARGPFAGIASAPIMLLTGARVPENSPVLFPWQPFDAQGFMAYRIAMMGFGCTALLSLWELVRTIGSRSAARFAVLFGITTPFFLNDLWFTWPKLLAASFAILGATMLLRRKPVRAGALVSAGYMMHPSGLLALSALVPIALWPLRGARLRRPRLLVLIRLLIPVGIVAEAWKRYNGIQYMQNGFLDYVKEAYPYYRPSVGQWIHFRLNVLGDTLIPLYLPIGEGHSISINIFGGISPGVVHFFFQYYTGVPFGFGISFFPLLLMILWRAARRWPWPFVAGIAIPFVAFFVYWGASVTGMLREGLQVWVVAVMAVVALELAATNFALLRSRAVRVILVLRAVEVLAVAVGATLGTRGLSVISADYTLNDIAVVVALITFALLLMVSVWRETGRLAPPAPEAGSS